MVFKIIAFLLAAILGCFIALIAILKEISVSSIWINESLRNLNRTLMGIHNFLYKFQNININVHTNEKIEDAN